jgi:hypothetical protein
MLQKYSKNAYTTNYTLYPLIGDVRSVRLQQRKAVFFFFGEYGLQRSASLSTFLCSVYTFSHISIPSSVIRWVFDLEIILMAV